MAGGVFTLIVLVFIVMVILSWLIIVPEQQEVIVEMLGKYHKTMKAGVNFKLPFVQTIRNRVSLKEHIHDLYTEGLGDIFYMKFYNFINKNIKSSVVKELFITIYTIIFPFPVR